MENSDSLFNTLHWDKLQTLKKFPQGEVNVRKLQSFLVREFLLLTLSYLTYDSNINWSTGFTYLKLCMTFSIFDSVSISLKFTFLFQKIMDSLILKLHNSFQNWNDRKATHAIAPRILIFKLQQKFLKFSDICMSWYSQKSDLETKFWDLENLTFWESTFCSIGNHWLIGIALLINLFISLFDPRYIH